MFLLDTDAVSEIRKIASGRADRNVAAWIAATALSHDMVLVTRNAKDFHRFADLRILSPWDRSQGC